MGDYRGYGKAATPLLPMIGDADDGGHGQRGAELRGDRRCGHAHEDGLRRSVGRRAHRDPRPGADAHRAPSRHRDGGLRRDRARGRDRGDAAPDAAVGHVLAPGLDAARRRVRARPAQPADGEARAAMHARRALRRHGDRAVDARRRARLRQSRSPPATTSRTASRSRFSCRTSSAGTPPRRAIATRRCSIRRAAARATTMPPKRSRSRLEDLASAGGLAMKLSDSGRGGRARCPSSPPQAAQQWTGTFNPRPFDAEGAMEIYRAAL